MTCYYVYLHRKKTTGEVFYVGKGKNKRAWDRHGRSDLWKKTATKCEWDVEILQDNLQEWYAFELETGLIALYGRLDLGNGSLVNLSDGGEGPGGEGHPYCDHNIYTFYNLDTNETVKSTRINFKRMFPEVKINHLISGFSKSSMRWVVKELITEDELGAARLFYKGKYSKISNLEKVDFTNLYTGEVINCNRYELLDLEPTLTHDIVSSLIKGNTKVCKGWVLASTLLEYSADQLLNPCKGLSASFADQSIYTFKNIVTGEIFQGTRIHFTEKYGITVYPLFTKTKINYKTKNWCLLENEDLAKRNTSGDSNTYSLINKDGEEFTGTRQEFKAVYGFTFHSLVALNNTCKTCKGWRLVN